MEKQKVIVTDIQMPFWSMVVFMIKWTIASIPAIFILFILLGLFGAVVTGLFHALGLIPGLENSI